MSNNAQIKPYMKPLYEHFALKGRSVNLTGGQILLPYAISDDGIYNQMRKIYLPDEDEVERRQQKYQASLQYTPERHAADRPRTPRGMAAANASARHRRPRSRRLQPTQG